MLAVVVESFAFKAVCRSVWEERVPVMEPQVVVEEPPETVVQVSPLAEVEEAVRTVPLEPGFKIFQFPEV